MFGETANFTTSGEVYTTPIPPSIDSSSPTPARTARRSPSRATTSGWSRGSGSSVTIDGKTAEVVSWSDLAIQAVVPDQGHHWASTGAHLERGLQPGHLHAHVVQDLVLRRGDHQGQHDRRQVRGVAVPAEPATTAANVKLHLHAGGRHHHQHRTWWLTRQAARP